MEARYYRHFAPIDSMAGIAIEKRGKKLLTFDEIFNLSDEDVVKRIENVHGLNVGAIGRSDSCYGTRLPDGRYDSVIINKVVLFRLEGFSLAYIKLYFKRLFGVEMSEREYRTVGQILVDCLTDMAKSAIRYSDQDFAVLVERLDQELKPKGVDIVRVFSEIEKRFKDKFQRDIVWTENIRQYDLNTLKSGVPFSLVLMGVVCMANNKLFPEKHIDILHTVDPECKIEWGSIRQTYARFFSQDIRDITSSK